jgi:peptidoglycan/LPS O-acetylase OafA/YrhL
MKSSSGEHFLALDHVRALAAFMVFSNHFIHDHNGYPVPFANVPVPPLNLLHDGWTGVSLFMALSGYLFAKLLDGRRIDWPAFLWNRFLRLAPLLCVVILIVGVIKVSTGTPVIDYLRSITSGMVAPTLPNGGWSITVEGHFYLMLPLLLWMTRRWTLALLYVLAGAIVARGLFYLHQGEIHWLAYWTIVGRIDQFLLGLLAYQLRGIAKGRHVAAVTAGLTLALAYWAFSRTGWLYDRPSPTPVWIFLPALEGAAYAFMIAYYDTSFAVSRGRFSRALGAVGTYSYSIYLLHFFFVFHMSRFVDQNLMWLSTSYRAVAWSLIGFALMVPVGHFSFKYLESPFLRLRRRYVLGPQTAKSPVSAAASMKP